MPRLTLTLALMFAPAFAFAQSLTGVYDLWGRNVDGSVYEGSVEIRDNGEEVKVFWDTNAGVYSGTGERDGNVLLVDWGDDFLAIYTIMSDGELHGTWADGYALERLAPR